jgi:hypothetical protein
VKTTLKMCIGIGDLLVRVVSELENDLYGAKSLNGY